MSKLKIYAKAIALPVAVGLLMGILVAGFMDYEEIRKPFLSPAGVVFPIVWTVLYVLMGVSYGRLIEKGRLDAESDKLYRIQLLVNAIWPLVFFVLKWRKIAVVVIAALLYLVYKMVVEFKKRDTLAGQLQIPYLVWLVYATYLNIGVALLN